MRTKITMLNIGEESDNHFSDMEEDVGEAIQSWLQRGSITLSANMLKKDRML